jgi:hypothetical protein
MSVEDTITQRRLVEDFCTRWEACFVNNITEAVNKKGKFLSPIGQQCCLNGSDKLPDRGSLTRQTGNALRAPYRGPPGGEAGTATFGTARWRRPLRKHNAMAQAVEGSLGGFCVHRVIGLSRGLSYPLVAL